MPKLSLLPSLQDPKMLLTYLRENFNRITDAFSKLDSDADDIDAVITTGLDLVSKQEFVCNITQLLSGLIYPPGIGPVEPPFFPDFNGSIIGARLSTKSNVLPSSQVKVDLLKNGVSIFGAPPTITAGQSYGANVAVTVPFNADDKLQPFVLTPGGADIIVLSLIYKRT